MRHIVAAAVLAMFAFGACAHEAEKPTKEHEWLKKLAGEWETEGEMYMDPAAPPMKIKGSETGRTVGSFWAMNESKGEFMGAPFTGLLSLGFSPDSKKFVGTWIDSMNSFMWRYEGKLDDTGKILTLETEGPSCMEVGKTMKVRETVEFKDDNTKVFTSKFEKDGKWLTMMTMTAKRKK